MRIWGIFRPSLGYIDGANSRKKDIITIPGLDEGFVLDGGLLKPVPVTYTKNGEHVRWHRRNLTVKRMF